MVSTRNSVNARGVEAGGAKRRRRLPGQALRRRRAARPGRGAAAHAQGHRRAGGGRGRRRGAARRGPRGPGGQRSLARRRRVQGLAGAQRGLHPSGRRRVRSRRALQRSPGLPARRARQLRDPAQAPLLRGRGGLVRSLRDVIEISVRKIDLVFRLDERGYILLLPNTHFPGALAVAERISLDTSKLVLDAEPNLRCTVSVGVSFFPNKDTHSVQDLIDLVGAALERARSEGGGKICLFQHQGYLYAPEAS
ncbi:diguanylate cyclase [Pseudenhygromyxa sp. WMMC2535]|uniref:diguanylate cyclase domain-containing protein n=1 Tax=Pseudenhygromyxa sp. WMMC2535 TaxID=2712867 RepID=UPI0020D006F1|nr:diguanylate cyclase [Pseudenhygromyxa sp. WMMC2535]